MSISLKINAPHGRFCTMRALVDDIRTAFEVENDTAIHIPRLVCLATTQTE